MADNEQHEDVTTPADRPEASEAQAAEVAEPQAAETQGTAQAAPAAEQAPLQSPKERRRSRRDARRAAPRAPLTPAERAAERLERRRRRAQARRAYRAKLRSRRAKSPSTTPVTAEPRGAGRPKVRLGVVVSDRPDKTIVVRIDEARRHRRYEKIVHTTRTLHAHDERNEASAGDTVRVVESRPLSRTKRWRLVEILERAK